MDDKATKLVIELARHAIGYGQASLPGWREIYVRFDAPTDFQQGVRASYTTEHGVTLIDMIQQRDFVAGVMRLAAELRNALSNNERQFCVCLLRANSKFDYHIDFEWEDATKWNITKLNGADGLPEGLAELSPLDK